MKVALTALAILKLLTQWTNALKVSHFHYALAVPSQKLLKPQQALQAHEVCFEIVLAVLKLLNKWANLFRKVRRVTLKLQSVHVPKSFQRQGSGTRSCCSHPEAI